MIKVISRNTIKRGLRSMLAMLPHGDPCREGPCLRILTYHRVNDHSADPVAIRSEQFAWQMAHIKERYDVIRIDDVGSLANDRKNYFVAITFDDGYMDNYAVAAPILEYYGIPACFFITTAHLGTNKRFAWDVRDSVDAPMMEWEHVRELARAGHLIGAHTKTHPCLSVLGRAEQFDEINGSLKDIEEHLGWIPSAFAYPFGRFQHFNSDSDVIVRNQFSVCCNNIRGLNRLHNCDLLSLNRSNVQQWWGKTDFAAELKGAYDFLEKCRG